MNFFFVKNGDYLIEKEGAKVIYKSILFYFFDESILLRQKWKPYGQRDVMIEKECTSCKFAICLFCFGLTMLTFLSDVHIYMLKSLIFLG